jgi:hypothetical protein
MEWPQFKSFLPPNQPPEAITCGPVVYVSTLKCASSFFHESFRRLQWDKIKFDLIDWKNQRVFGHILDPDIRRNKAVAEVIAANQAYELFYNDESFRQLIKHVPLLDGHSLSYYDVYGNQCEDIDWIPITGRSHQEVVDKTNEFLVEIGNIKLFNRYAWDHAHIGDSKKKKLEQDLTELWEIDRPESSDQYLQRDRDLYRRVITQFDFKGATWATSSWLTGTANGKRTELA